MATLIPIFHRFKDGYTMLSSINEEMRSLCDLVMNVRPRKDFVIASAKYKNSINIVHPVLRIVISFQDPLRKPCIFSSVWTRRCTRTGKTETIHWVIDPCVLEDVVSRGACTRSACVRSLQERCLISGCG